MWINSVTRIGAKNSYSIALSWNSGTRCLVVYRNSRPVFNASVRAPQDTEQTWPRLKHSLFGLRWEFNAMRN